MRQWYSMLARPGSRAQVSRLMVAIAFFLSIVISSATILKARAESDTTPMEFVSLEITTPTIDVSAEDAYAELVGEIYEDMSGFDSVYFTYRSPSGNQLIEGDANGDPQFVNTAIRFPQNAEAGVWKPTFTLKDSATNVRVYTPEDLQGLGFNANVNVVSDTPDVVAPVLNSMSLDMSSIDTGSGTSVLSGTANITDNMTTLNEDLCYVTLTSPSGNQIVSGIISNTSGDDFLISAPFQQYTEVGVWTMDLTIADSVTNSRTYDSSELAGLGFPSSVTVTGNPDTTPVSINSLDFTAAFPPIGDIYPNSSKVTIYANLTDNLAGIGSADLYFDSQSSTQVASAIATYDGEDYQYTVFLPPFAATGEWLPRFVTYDQAGNTQTLQYTDLLNLGFDLRLDIVSNESGQVAADESLSTDTDNSGATETEPFIASVTTPLEGEVSISQVALTEPISANDYLVFDQQYDIEAPDATVESPLELRFRVDQSRLAGQTAQTVVVFRNGALVDDCLVSGVTDPDPCVTERNTLGDGDVELVVLTSHASTWVLGYEAPSGESYSFAKFRKPVKPAPQMNKAEQGSTIPVKFVLSGDHSGNVLPAHVATSQQIACSTKNPIGQPTNINTNGNGLTYNSNSNTYKFKWKTLKQWKNSCRQLTLEFSNGETVNAYFHFKD